MLSIEPAPKYFQYDLDGICYFEVYPNGEVVEVLGDITSVGDNNLFADEDTLTSI